MVLLNLRIIWLENGTIMLEEIHLLFYQRIFDRIRWAMLNLWVLSWRSAVTYLSTFDIRISYVFIRLILSVFFFEAVSCTKNVEHDWKKLDMNDSNGKIRLVTKMTCKLYKDTHFVFKILFPKKIEIQFSCRAICLKFVKMFKI